MTEPLRFPSRLGRRRVDGPPVEIRSPYDGQVVGTVAQASAADMEAAIGLAHETFAQTRRAPVHERAAVLTRTARLLEREADGLAELMARESGKPIRFCRGEVARAVVTFDLGSAVIRTLHGEVLPIDLQARAEGRLCLSTRVPRGPVAAISPFNFPLNLVAHKLSPALAVGAPVVLKPPPQCPLTAFRLGELLDEAGMNPDALSILHCEPAVAQTMVEDDRMKVLSFTGSDTVGWKLKSVAGKKQVLLELGGNAPCIIDEGVEIDPLLDKLMVGAWANAGQVCIKIQRLFVHESLFDRFLERFVERTTALRCGDPLDPEVMVGPVIDAHHAQRIVTWAREAVDAGATLHCGGTAEGNVVRPTVLTNVSPQMRVDRDEVFGPITVVHRFDRFDDAIAACNAGRFGLQAGVFTRDMGRAMQAWHELDYGGVMIGEIPTFRVDNFPYGGTKDSGFGREGVRYAIEEMTEPKVLVMAT